MTLWLKEDTFVGFVRGWGLSDDKAERIEVDQVRSGKDGQLCFRIRGVGGIDLTKIDMQGLDRFVQEIGGEYLVETEAGGSVCIYVYGPVEASGGYAEPLRD